MKPIFVYVIGASRTGPVKIGFSQDPDQRLRQLQTGHAAPLEVFHRQDFEPKRAKVIEKIIHNTLKHQRKSGEWFDISVEEAILEVEFALIRHGEGPIIL